MKTIITVVLYIGPKQGLERIRYFTKMLTFEYLSTVFSFKYSYILLVSVER